MKSLSDLRGHLIHHSFPNLHRKVAVSVIDTTIKLALIALIYYLFLSPFTIGLIFIGLIGTMIFYDCIHYYCHFGPEINIKWLKYLRINHLKHHYRDPTRYFGVTNTFWDDVFGTGEKSKLKK
jgi:sterol desaturase/sphingolipid hydroxylase (fatty acid hydroxylase superfamily)